jgi:hypothetical protein
LLCKEEKRGKNQEDEPRTQEAFLPQHLSPSICPGFTVSPDLPFLPMCRCLINRQQAKDKQSNKIEKRGKWDHWRGVTRWARAYDIAINEFAAVVSSTALLRLALSLWGLLGLGRGRVRGSGGGGGFFADALPSTERARVAAGNKPLKGFKTLAG